MKIIILGEREKSLFGYERILYSARRNRIMGRLIKFDSGKIQITLDTKSSDELTEEQLRMLFIEVKRL